MKNDLYLWRTRTTTVTLILLALGFFAESTAQTGKASQKEVLPKAVITAFEKAYPHATIKNADKELKDGKTFYEIESIEGTRRRDILYTPDGNAYEIEEGIALTEVPQAIKNTISRAYPKSNIKKAERITRGTTVEYEITIAKGEVVTELILDGIGKVLKTVSGANGGKQ